MYLLLNDQRREIPLNSPTVETVVNHCYHSDFRGVVEYNGRVLSREEWPLIVAQDGDRLEVVQIVGGG